LAGNVEALARQFEFVVRTDGCEAAQGAQFDPTARQPHPPIAG
jgi:hypothetical protein